METRKSNNKIFLVVSGIFVLALTIRVIIYFSENSNSETTTEISVDVNPETEVLSDEESNIEDSEEYSDYNEEIEESPVELGVAVANSKRAYFYSKPDYYTKTSKFIVKGQNADIIEIDGDFVKVNFEYKGNYTTGYLNTQDVSLISPNSYAGKQAYRIDDPDGYTNLRVSPNGKLIRKVYLDEFFWIVESKNEWTKVIFEDGTTGFLFSNRLVPN